MLHTWSLWTTGTERAHRQLHHCGGTPSEVYQLWGDTTVTTLRLLGAASLPLTARFRTERYRLVANRQRQRTDLSARMLRAVLGGI